MFTLVSAGNSIYGVLDSFDNTVDSLSEPELRKILKIGLGIKGASLDSAGNVKYTNEFFTKPAVVISEAPARFKLIAELNDSFMILDMASGKYNDCDIYERDVVQKYLNQGIKILGVTRNSPTNFTFTKEHFVIMSDEPENTEPETLEFDSDEATGANYDVGENDEDDGDFSSDEGIVDYVVGENDEDDEADGDFSSDSVTDTRIKDLYDMLITVQTRSEQLEHVADLDKQPRKQLNLLKRYYLAVSQQSFNSAVGKKHQLTPSKEAVLEGLRKQGVYWQYAGYIDMGSLDAGAKCTMNHALRYVHLAWDTGSSDLENTFWGDDYSLDIDEKMGNENCIMFGADCIADFFEVGREDIKSKLMLLQRESVEDMRLLHSIYVGKDNAGKNVYNDMKVDLYKESFVLFESLMAKLVASDNMFGIFGKEDEIILPKLLTSFYLKFKEAGMVYPYSLILNIRNHIFDWAESKEKKFKKVRDADVSYILEFCKTVFRKKYETSKVLEGSMINCLLATRETGAFRAYLQVLFRYEMCGEYSYKPDKFMIESGHSIPVKEHYSAIYKRVSNDFWSNAEYTVGYLEKAINARLRELELVELFSPTDYKITTLVQNTDGTYKTSDPKPILFSYVLNNYLRNNPDMHPVVAKLRDWGRCPATVDEFLAKSAELIPEIEDFKEKFEGLSRAIVQVEVDKKNIEEASKRQKAIAPSPPSPISSPITPPSIPAVDDKSWEDNTTTIVDGLVLLLEDPEVSEYAKTKAKKEFNTKQAMAILNTMTVRKGVPSHNQYYYLKMLAKDLIAFKEGKES